MKRAIVFLLAASLSLCAGCHRRPAAAAPKPVETFTIVTPSNVEMVYLSGGEFMMGNGSGNPDENPPHKVTVSGFLMDKYPVTHDLFLTLQVTDPSSWDASTTLKTPVESITWIAAKGYCNELSRKEELKPCYNEKTVEWECDYSANGYRLPTEAEWEFAARAGSESLYDCESADQLGKYAWFADNSGARTHVVGEKKPNAWGLHDMYGNVSQWCEDVYSETYYAQSPAVDPTGPPRPGQDVKRVLRGGNWKATAPACRVTYRRGERTGNTDACFHTAYCGFRCVRRPSAEELVQLRKVAK